MSRSETGVTLEAMITDLGDHVALIHEPGGSDVTVSHVAVWLPGDSTTLAPGSLVVCPASRQQTKPWEALSPLLESDGVAALLIWSRPGSKIKVPATVGLPVLLADESSDAGTLVLLAAQALSSPLERTSDFGTKSNRHGNRGDGEDAG